MLGGHFAEQSQSMNAAGAEYGTPHSFECVAQFAAAPELPQGRYCLVAAAADGGGVAPGSGWALHASPWALEHPWHHTAAAAVPVATAAADAAGRTAVGGTGGHDGDGHLGHAASHMNCAAAFQALGSYDGPLAHHWHPAAGLHNEQAAKGLCLLLLLLPDLSCCSNGRNLGPS